MRCAAPETRRKPAYYNDAKPDGSRKRQADLTDAKKAKLLVEWGSLPTDAGGWKVGVGPLAARTYETDAVPERLTPPRHSPGITAFWIH